MIVQGVKAELVAGRAVVASLRRLSIAFSFQRHRRWGEVCSGRVRVLAMLQRCASRRDGARLGSGRVDV